MNQEKLGAITIEVRWAMLDQTLALLGREEHTLLITGPDGSILYQPGDEAPSKDIILIIERSDRGFGVIHAGVTNG